MSNHSGVCEGAAVGAVDGPGSRLRAEREAVPSTLDAALARTPEGPFTELLAAAHRFRADVQEDGGADLLDGLVVLRHVCDLLELSFSTLSHRFHADALAARPSDGVAPLFVLRTSCHMAAHAAADAVRIGEQAPSLPLSTAALEQGRIGLPQLALIARTAEELASSPLGFDEAQLLPLAERHPLKRFGRDCAHARHAADRASFLDEQRVVADARWLDIKPLGDDAGYDVRGFLDPVGGAAVHAVLDALARPCGEGDRRDRRHRLGDAAVELCAHVLDEGGIFVDADSTSPAGDGEGAPHADGISPELRNAPVARLLPPGVLENIDLAAPRRGPWGGADADEKIDRFLWHPLAQPAWLPADAVGSGHVPRRRHVPHLMVSASLETLLGLPGAPAGELEGVPVAAETVARLACDASVSRILLGPDSAIVDVGRARRLPSPAARRALVHRDRGCVWPGCDRPPRWTQPHHFRHWARGGSSDVGNLGLVCFRHHVKVHEDGWELVRTADGVTAIPPPPEYPFVARPLAEAEPPTPTRERGQPVKLRPT